jgi:uncharacterized OB-fold protein
MALYSNDLFDILAKCLKDMELWFSLQIICWYCFSCQADMDTIKTNGDHKV